MIRLALHHLAVIRSLGGTGNVSATARELGLTQSAISHRMKEAERRVGSSLFYRDGHTISLNPAGRRLLQSADIILAEVSLAERDLERLSSGFSDTIRIGAACYAGFDWFPRLFGTMQNTHPNVSVEIVSEVLEDPTRLLTGNLADIVIAAAPVEHSNIVSVPLVRDQLVAVLPPTHRCCLADFIDPMIFVEEVYVTHHTLPEPGREYNTLFKPLGIMPKQVITAGRSQAVLELVQMGAALTILPQLSVQSQAQRMNLVLKPVGETGIPITWYALLKKKAEADSLLSEITDLLMASL